MVRVFRVSFDHSGFSRGDAVPSSTIAYSRPALAKTIPWGSQRAQNLDRRRGDATGRQLPGTSLWWPCRSFGGSVVLGLFVLRPVTLRPRLWRGFAFSNCPRARSPIANAKRACLPASYGCRNRNIRRSVKSRITLKVSSQSGVEAWIAFVAEGKETLTHATAAGYVSGARNLCLDSRVIGDACLVRSPATDT